MKINIEIFIDEMKKKHFRIISANIMKNMSLVLIAKNLFLTVSQFSFNLYSLSLASLDVDKGSLINTSFYFEVLFCWKSTAQRGLRFLHHTEVGRTD